MKSNSIGKWKVRTWKVKSGRKCGRLEYTKTSGAYTNKTRWKIRIEGVKNILIFKKLAFHLNSQKVSPDDIEKINTILDLLKPNNT